METLGLIFIATAATVMVALAIYGLFLFFFGPNEGTFFRSVMIKVDRRGHASASVIATKSPLPAAGDPSSAEGASPPGLRSIDELYAEMLTLRESIAEMAVQMRTLRLALAARPQATRATARTLPPSMAA